MECIVRVRTAMDAPEVLADKKSKPSGFCTLRETLDWSKTHPSIDGEEQWLLVPHPSASH
jgi:hypothetical protein